MCRRVTCEKCHKPTFAGCGKHIEQVLGDVKPEDRCDCHAADAAVRPIEGGLSQLLRSLWG
jgi:hypothetical protein